MNGAELYYSLRILRDDHLATDLIHFDTMVYLCSGFQNCIC